MNQDLVGKIVKGPSGRHLGRVMAETLKQISVQVDGETVWLARDVIFSIEEDQVTVIFEPSSVARYAQRPPARRSRRTG